MQSRGGELITTVVVFIFYSELFGTSPPRAQQQQRGQSVLARLPPSAQASFRAKFQQLPSHQQQFVFNKLTTASPQIQVDRD